MYAIQNNDPSSITKVFMAPTVSSYRMQVVPPKTWKTEVGAEKALAKLLNILEQHGLREYGESNLSVVFV